MKTKEKESVKYRVIRSVEIIDGKTVEMYGFSGYSKDGTLVLSSLSDDRRRICNLVSKMNKLNLELNAVKNAVGSFLDE